MLHYRKEQRFIFKMNEMRFPSQVCIIRVHDFKAVCNMGLSYVSELVGGGVVSCSSA